MARVDQNLIDSYNRVAPELLMLSKRLQRSVSSALRDRRQGGKQTGLLIGKRLNQHALHRTDGRIFYNSRLPTEPINLSVGLLIDESGSMCSNDRITRARATAIVIQDFCESLGIPLLVVGHTAWSSHVELFSYSDFDTYDKNNRYRLMDMSARDCNRDGAALRFVAEKLSKQTSEVKILMIICDGSQMMTVTPDLQQKLICVGSNWSMRARASRSMRRLLVKTAHESSGSMEMAIWTSPTSTSCP